MNLCLYFAESILLTLESEQSHDPCAFYGNGKIALMLYAYAGRSARNDLSVLGNVTGTTFSVTVKTLIVVLFDVFNERDVVDFVYFVDTEGANLLFGIINDKNKLS